MTRPISRRALGLGLAALAACGAPAQTPAPGPPFDPNARPAFPLKRAAGKRYIVDAAGRPFLLWGDTAWSMVANLRREEVETYLTDRAGRGFNAVLCNVIEKYHAQRAPRNAYGEHPFDGRLDFRGFNDVYFAHFDHIVRRAAELNLLVMAAPAYLGAKGTMGGFYQEMIAAGAEALRGYGRFLGARYAHADNIMWVMGGDFSPPEKLITRALAEGLAEGGSRGLRTAHCSPWQDALETFEGEAWIDINTVYTYGSIRDGSRKAWVRESQMPFFMLESAYEGSDAVAHFRVRQQAYEAMLSGGFGHVFGNSPIWYFNGPAPGGALERDWTRALDTPGARQMTIAHDLFRHLEWPLLAPDFDGRFLRNGGGEDGPTAAVASSGAFALVYAPKSTAFDLDLSRLSGPRLTMQWIDPTTGARTAAGQAAHFEPMPANAAGHSDWALLIESHA